MVFGNQGDDLLIGTGSNNELFGGSGNDTVRGNDSILRGDNGDDLLIGSGSTFNGGSGADTFQILQGGTSVIRNLEAVDTIQIEVGAGETLTQTTEGRNTIFSIQGQNDPLLVVKNQFINLDRIETL